MNREILFRAISDSIGDYVFGHYSHECKYPDSISKHWIGWYVINPDTLGQFTGLIDKNGTFIYEGDVVRILYTDWPSNTDPNIELEDYLISISKVGPIVYQALVFGVELKNFYGEMQLYKLDVAPHGRIEVIGNIFSNPELLNK